MFSIFVSIVTISPHRLYLFSLYKTALTVTPAQWCQRKDHVLKDDSDNKLCTFIADKLVKRFQSFGEVRAEQAAWPFAKIEWSIKSSWPHSCLPVLTIPCRRSLTYTVLDFYYSSLIINHYLITTGLMALWCYATPSSSLPGCEHIIVRLCLLLRGYLTDPPPTLTLACPASLYPICVPSEALGHTCQVSLIRVTLLHAFSLNLLHVQLFALHMQCHDFQEALILKILHATQCCTTTMEVIPKAFNRQLFLHIHQ